MEREFEQDDQQSDAQPVNKSLRYVVIGVVVLIALFILSLFIAPLLHPDSRITKTGVITNVATSGDPYFNQTIYTLTFQDGDVIRVNAQNSVPFPVGKPVSITYSAREKQLLDVNTGP